MVEMLMCPSLGTGRGRPAVEAPLQTLKGTLVSIIVVGRQQSWTEAIHYVRRARESPREQMAASLHGFFMLPTSPVRPLIILRTAMPGPRRSHAGAAGSCQSQQNFQLHPFCGCPGQRSWPGKLLTIPILNTSVMVYGP